MSLFKALEAPSPIRWQDTGQSLVGIIGSHHLAWIRKTPDNDRGPIMVDCYLPDIDTRDEFPRYYPSQDRAIFETEAFLRRKLWPQHTCPRCHGSGLDPERANVQDPPLMCMGCDGNGLRSSPEV